MHIQYCKSTYDKGVAPDPSICHQIHPLSAISTTGKKEENMLKFKTSEMHINSREDRLKKIICMKKIREISSKTFEKTTDQNKMKFLTKLNHRKNIFLILGLNIFFISLNR